jgi:hypothetical protein
MRGRSGASLECCYNFLYGFKGAPSARHACGQARAPRVGANIGGELSGCNDRRQRPELPGSRRCGAAASLAPFGRWPCGRGRLPRTAAPTPTATGSRRNGPGAARHEQDQADGVAPCAPVAGRKVTGSGPERRALSGSAPPASTVLRIPLCGTRLRRAVDPGASTDPAGLTARARPEARPEVRAANLRACTHYSGRL